MFLIGTRELHTALSRARYSILDSQVRRMADDPGAMPDATGGKVDSVSGESGHSPHRLISGRVMAVE